MIDLRSDTVTLPTPEMRRAMAEAEVGDDVYAEDPTVNRLQERAAEIFGKESALFVPTGTMGNQIAIKLHTRPGQEVVVEERSHVFNYEMAMMAAFSGCLARPVRAEQGILTGERVRSVLKPDLYYVAPIGLVVLENTHNFAGGTVMSADQTRAVAETCHSQGLPVHLDGARLFNASIALGEPVSRLAEGCDSVMISLSKGLCAPIGSLLLGPKEFIQEAWSVRKMLGGGMRQVGVVAAAGLLALEKMPSRLQQDHDTARALAEGLSGMQGIEIDPQTVQTNIVLADLTKTDSTRFLGSLKEKGIMAGSAGPRQIRFVTHKEVTRQDIESVLTSIREIQSS